MLDDDRKEESDFDNQESCLITTVESHAGHPLSDASDICMHYLDLAIQND